MTLKLSPELSEGLPKPTNSNIEQKLVEVGTSSDQQPTSLLTPKQITRRLILQVKAERIARDFSDGKIGRIS